MNCACGKSGHQRTMLRFVIDGDKIKELEIMGDGKVSFFIFNRLR
jgi:hypothetical protein